MQRQALETNVGHGLESVVTDAGPWCLLFYPMSGLSTPCGQQKGVPAEQSFQICCLHQEGIASIAATSAHGLTEELRPAGTAGDHPIQPPAQSWVSYSRLPKTTSRWFLDIS